MANSRQARYQQRQHAQGLCAYCPKKVWKGSWYCREHLVRKRERARARTGSQPQTVTGRGRPAL